MSPTKLWSSQYPVQDPGSRRIYLLQKIKNCRRGPAATMRGSNMGIPPYWPDILLITWGRLLHKAGSLFFYIMRGYTELFCFKAASGLPLENFINITWGLGRVRTNAIPLDRREPPDHLGTWSRLNQSCLLIGLRPQNHLGAWSNPNHCHATWLA